MKLLTELSLKWDLRNGWKSLIMLANSFFHLAKVRAWRRNILILKSKSWYWPFPTKFSCFYTEMVQEVVVLSFATVKMQRPWRDKIHYVWTFSKRVDRLLEFAGSYDLCQTLMFISVLVSTTKFLSVMKKRRYEDRGLPLFKRWPCPFTYKVEDIFVSKSL